MSAYVILVIVVSITAGFVVGWLCDGGLRRRIKNFFYHDLVATAILGLVIYAIYVTCLFCFVR